MPVVNCSKPCAPSREGWIKIYITRNKYLYSFISDPSVVFPTCIRRAENPIFPVAILTFNKLNKMGSNIINFATYFTPQWQNVTDGLSLFS